MITAGHGSSSLLKPPGRWQVCHPGEWDRGSSSSSIRRRRRTAAAAAAVRASQLQMKQQQQQQHRWLKPVAAAAAGAAYPSDDAFGRAGGSAEPLKQQQQQVQGASMPATVFNLINVIMGAGYVSIPFSLKQGGWAALPVLWLLAACFCYTGQTLLQCCQLVDKQQQQQQERQQENHQQQQQNQQQQQRQQQDPEGPQAGYEAVAGAAFGQLGEAAVSVLMYAELLGYCCVYVVIEADILSCLLSHTQFGTSLLQQLGPGAFGLLASLLMVPTVLLPDLSALSVLGAVGVAAAAVVGLVLAAVFCSGAVSNIGSTALPAAAAAPAASSCGGLPGSPGAHSLLQLATLPQALGILPCVYAGHSTFPVIQRSMASPSKGPRAVVLGYLAVALICSVLGAFGYALYGHQTAEVITANLPAGSLVALACTLLTGCNPISAFAVTLEPVAVALQGKLARRQLQQQQQQPGNSVGSVSGMAGQQAAVPAAGSHYRSRGGLLTTDIMSGNTAADAAGDTAAGVAGVAAAAAVEGDVGAGEVHHDQSSGSVHSAAPEPAVRAAVRLGLALVCCIIANLLPYVAEVMGLVGSVLTMSISLIIPALMHVRLFRDRLSPWALGLDAALLLLGVVCAVFGSSSALHDLQLKLSMAAAAT